MRYAVIYTMLDIERNAGCRPRHVDFLRRLLREGKVVEGMKFPDYRPGGVQGVLVCEAASREEVAAWFEEDPVIAEGARRFEVRDYEPMSLRP